jgi:hypothetical protein
LFCIQIPYRSSFIPAPIQSHIDLLYEQIDDLTLQLFEERSKNKQIRIQVRCFFLILFLRKEKYILLG